jgi:hypothetical protein
MAVTVVRDAVTLNNGSQVGLLKIDMQPSQNYVRLSWGTMQLIAIAVLKGRVNNNARLGFIQLGWPQIIRHCYRGVINTDGSILAAALPNGPQRCIDVTSPVPPLINPKDVWYNDIAAPTSTSFDTVVSYGGEYPLPVTAALSDTPKTGAPLWWPNGVTGKTNYLHKIEYFSKFCTVLSLADPAKGSQFKHLKHLFWQVRCNVEFKFNSHNNTWSKPTRFGGVVLNRGTVYPIIDGPPTINYAWIKALQDVTQSVCNVIAKPRVREFKTWNCP